MMDLTKNSFINSIFVLVSQISGFLRDIFLAAFLGSGNISNMFLIALRLPFSFQQSLSGETFHSAFIPSLSAIKGEDIVYRRYQLAKNIFWITLLTLIPLIIIAVIFMPEILKIVAPGMVDQPKFDLLVLCSRICFPYLSFIMLSSVFVGLLNYRNKFAVTASLPIILNLSIVLYIIFSNDLSDNRIISLGFTLLIGGFLQIMLLLLLTEKEFWRTPASIKNGMNEVKNFFYILGPTFFSQTFIQINVLVGIIFASFFEGAISYIYFADRVYMLPLALTGISIATVLIPDLSRFINTNDISDALNLQNKAYKLTLALCLPASVILIFLSQDIVKLIYQRGEFLEESSIYTAQVLQLLSLGLPAACVTKILAPYFFAKQDPYTPFKVTSISVFTNIFMMIILFRSLGFYAIPISISLTSFLTMFVYLLIHKKNNFFVFTKKVRIDTFKYFALSIILGLEILGFKEFTQSFYVNESCGLFSIFFLMFLTFLIFLKLFDQELIDDLKSLLTKADQQDPN